MTDTDKKIKVIYELTTEVYSEDELRKCLKALREKYSISSCDILPYYPKSMRVFTALQIVDLDKFKPSK